MAIYGIAGIIQHYTGRPVTSAKNLPSSAADVMLNFLSELESFLQVVGHQVHTWQIESLRALSLCMPHLEKLCTTVNIMQPKREKGEEQPLNIKWYHIRCTCEAQPSLRLLMVPSTVLDTASGGNRPLRRGQ